MTRQIEGVYDNIPKYAKKEFLEKGYNEASLRTIAEKDNTSTGSIYTRFSDKEGLFVGVEVEYIKKFIEFTNSNVIKSGN